MRKAKVVIRDKSLSCDFRDEGKYFSPIRLIHPFLATLSQAHSLSLHLRLYFYFSVFSWSPPFWIPYSTSHFCPWRRGITGYSVSHQPQPLVLTLSSSPALTGRWLQMTREKIDVEYGLNGFQPMHPPFLIFWEVEALRVKFRGLSSTYVTPLIEGQPQDRWQLPLLTCPSSTLTEA